MHARARVGQHAEAAKTADAMIVKPPIDNRTYYDVACGYALCFAAVTKGQPLESLDADGQKLARRYLDGFYGAIRKAMANGWRSPVDLETDPDFDVVRKDSAFPALVDEARKAAGPVAKS